MKYLDEYRDGRVASKVLTEIRWRQRIDRLLSAPYWIALVEPP